MTNTQKNKVPLVKGPKVEPPRWKVEDPRWYERAACQGAGIIELFDIANQPSAKAEEKELRARNICTMYCPVREDCAIESWKNNDTGVIRGGCRFVSGIGRSACMLCGMPTAKSGRLCLYCVCKRYCVSCEREYATAHQDDEPGLCPVCDPEQNTSRIKKVAA